MERFRFSPTHFEWGVHAAALDRKKVSRDGAGHRTRKGRVRSPEFSLAVDYQLDVLRQSRRDFAGDVALEQLDH